MKAALVNAAGATPVYADFAEPVAGAGLVAVRVAASALSHVSKSRASGDHYSGAGKLPFVPGIDGAGTLADGTRVYFVMPEAPYGGMGEWSLLDPARCLVLPAALDMVTAAAIANPGMSSWAALVERARLVKGETVLVNGATGVSGRLAVQVAKHLGAGRVIATGRNRAALQALRGLGADLVIDLTQDGAALDTAFQHVFGDGVDVVLDYLWGPSAERLLVAAARAAPEAVPIRYIQIGALSGASISLPSAALRSSSLVLMGSGIGSIPLPRLLHAIGAVLDATVAAGLQVATHSVPLAEVAQHWSAPDGAARTVFTM